MARRIRTGMRGQFRDAAGDHIKERAAAELGISAKDVRTAEVYTVDGAGAQEARQLARTLFSDPVAQTTPDFRNYDWVLEVGFKPGVTDNVGRSATDAIKLATGNAYPVYTSRQYAFKGVSKEDVERAASGLVANSLIERWEIKPGTGRFYPTVPKVVLPEGSGVQYVDLNVSDEDLVKLSRNRTLALNLDEMKAIQSYFDALGRQPRDAELEALAQTWSEHCKHKIFSGEVTYTDGRDTRVINSLFDTFIRQPTMELRKQFGKDNWLVSVFGDNAGVIKLDDDYYVAFKVETHNSPSALDPYGGAITGIVGVKRDIIGVGMGAKLLFNTDVFCFGDTDYKGPLPPALKHPQLIAEGVRRGVEHGGNKSGVPTVNGTVRYDSYPFGTAQGEVILSYAGKPLVYCGSGGVMPAKLNGRSSHKKRARRGDAVIVAGGRTGADGIHGATFSSESLSKSSPATAVQIGDPITQKRMADMLLEARDRGLYTSITDNGAGGLSCSVGEMASESGGAELYLEKVPVKYPGLQPWEILLSEAQERMTLAVPQANVRKFLRLAKRRGVEATVIGKYNNSGRFVSSYNGETVTDIDMDFLHNGAPKKKMRAVWNAPVYEEPKFEEPDAAWAIKELLARPNINSKEKVIRQYDHEVQANTVVKPLTGAYNDGPSDAAVIWPPEMRRKGSKRGIVISNGINSNYGFIDTYHMTASNMDEAIRNAVAVGANPRRIALLDNFCWSSPDDPYRMAQLVRANMALKDYMLAFGTPFISGKDSMHNDYRIDVGGKIVKISVPPTLAISALGITPDVTKSVTMDAKTPGNPLYLLGVTNNELGGSEYYAMMGAREGKVFIGNNVPRVNVATARTTYDALFHAIQNGYVAACHDCSDGGLGVAAAEMAFSGGYGIEIDLQRVPRTTTGFSRLLFSESNSRLLVEVPVAYQNAFEKTMGRQMDSTYAQVGQVTSGEYLTITNGHGSEKVHLQDLKNAWQGRK